MRISIHQGERINTEDDIRLKPVTLDELPVAAGIKLPETTDSDVLSCLWARWPQYSRFLVWQFIPRIGDWSNMNWYRLGLGLFEANTSLEVSAGPVTAPEKGLDGADSVQV